MRSTRVFGSELLLIAQLPRLVRGVDTREPLSCMSTTHPPAAWLEIPKHFGRRPDASFVSVSSVEEIALTEAARVQHHAAIAVLDELARRDLSLAWLAGELGENPDHLRRKLHGQVPANLRDLCVWGSVLGLTTVLPASAHHANLTGVAS